MKDVNKKQLLSIIIITIIYIAGIALCVAALFYKGLENTKEAYLVNCGVDLFGMIAGYILIICYLIDRDRPGEKKHFFIYLVNITFVGLFADFFSGILMQVPEWHMLYLIDNVVYFMVLPLECYFFYRYVTAVFKTKDKMLHIVDYVMGIGLILDLLSIIINVFTGMYFTVDSRGVYSRGPLYLCTYIYFAVAVILLIWIFIRRRKELDRNHVLAFSVFLGAPIVVAVLPDPADGLSVMCGVIMSTLIMTYCLVSIEQSKKQMAREKELSAATSIQHNMLPNVFPAFPEHEEFDVYASMTPAKEVGGDFYDMFLVDDDNLAILIADVSGKGITAALFMAQAKQMIQSQMMICKGNTVAALTAANLQLIENSNSKMFVTVWLGVINLSTGHMTFVDAGHNYSVIQRDGGTYELEKDKHSIVLVALKRAKFKLNEVDLKPNDTVFLYTDGVTEARNIDGELYGAERLIDSLNEAKDGTPKEIDAHVRKRVSEFVGKAEQFDDITTLCFRYLGENKKATNM